MILNLNIVSCSLILLGFSPTSWLKPYDVEEHMLIPDSLTIKKRTRGCSSFTLLIEKHRKVKGMTLEIRNRSNPLSGGISNEKMMTIMTKHPIYHLLSQTRHLFMVVWSSRYTIWPYVRNHYSSVWVHDQKLLLQGKRFWKIVLFFSKWALIIE